MTVVQNEATLSEKRRPGTGSSPKTAGSQSVNDNLAISVNTTFYDIFKNYFTFNYMYVC